MKNYQWLKYFLLAAAMNAMVLVFFDDICELQDRDIRISSFLPPLLGILWGWPGALGIGLGNFIADTMLGQYTNIPEFVGCLLGIVVNATYSVVAYYLWNSRLFSEKDINSNSQVLNFSGAIKTCVVFFASSLVGIIFLVYVTIPVYNGWDIGTIVSLQFGEILVSNFDVAMLLGTPLVIILARGDQLPRFSKSHIFGNRVKRPINLKLTCVICVFSLIFTCIVFASSMLSYSITQLSYPSTWVDIYRNLFIIVHSMFAFMLLAIYVGDTYLVSPIEVLTSSAHIIASNDYSKARPVTDLHTIKTQDELEKLSEVMDSMGQEIYGYVTQLTETTKRQQRMDAELEIAMRMQCSILPNSSVINDKYNCLEIDAIMYPARMVGGDFYDFGIIDEDHFYFTVADITGKGIPAAMFMTITCVLIRSKISAGRSPSDILSAANNEIIKNNSEFMFATCIFAIYEVSTGILRYVNAGHPLPIIVHPDDKPTELKELSGPVLGLMEDVEYKNFEAKLNRGDTIFFYSDGVTEAENAQNEFYGSERLYAAASDMKSLEKSRDIVGLMYESVASFVDGAEQSDDLTILGLYIK